ncbi:MAG: hypothetical protein H6641_25980 [Caldilineaceae bacterium]|nr:hypothetical protein [Caldilineaceae bacterium]
MDVNWIFGLLAILILLDYIYKQVMGRSFHHTIPRPVLWGLVFMSSTTAACCFALSWHIFTTRDFLLMGSSSFWLLLGIFLTVLAIAWLLPASANSSTKSQEAHAPDQPLPLVSHNSATAPHTAAAQETPLAPSFAERPNVFAASKMASPVPPVQALPMAQPSMYDTIAPAAQPLTKDRASRQTLLAPARPQELATALSSVIARPRRVPQIMVIMLMAFALLALGWQLGHIFALSQNESSVAVALPVLRPTPTATPLSNASLTERLVAQTVANVPVANPTSQPQLTPTAVFASVAFVITPIPSNSTTLKAKPAFAVEAVESANELPPIAFRRGNKSALPAAEQPATIAPVGGAISERAYYEAQNPVIRLLAPLDGDIVHDFVTLRWSSDFELPPEQHYEVVAWLEGQEPFKQGISLAPLMSTDHVRVNLALLDSALGPRFNPGIYRWGVMLVQRSPYQRIALLSNAQTLYYVPLGNP